MSWKLYVLGSNSAVPTLHRYPSGQVLNIGRESIMIDCGEGSQLRMLEYGIKNSRINTILISHLHGDHIYGLPGLLTSYNLYNRRNPLRIFGPRGIRDYVTLTMEITKHQFTYPIDFFELTHTGSLPVFENDEIQISAFPLIHRIPTYGYKIAEKINRPYLSKEKVKSLGLNNDQIQRIIKGEKVKIGNQYFQLADIERSPTPNSYAYVSDTAYFPKCGDLIGRVRLLYHEATFLDSEQKQAIERYHSTATEAARTALRAPADHLLLGHYSSRYTDIQLFKKEAEKVFKPVSLARSGKVFTIPQEGEILEEIRSAGEKYEL